MTPQVGQAGDLDVVAYCQDPHDHGFHILALVRFTERNPGHGALGRVSWGLLDVEAGEDDGAWISVRSVAESRGAADVVRGFWDLVDWHPDQPAASDAYHAARAGSVARE